MEIFSTDALWGICFFLMGIIALNKCNSVDHKNHYKMRKLRRLEWYGRREADAMATLPHQILGIFMTCGGTVLSLYGLTRFFGAVL